MSPTAGAPAPTASRSGIPTRATNDDDRAVWVSAAQRFEWPARRGVVLDGTNHAPALAAREIAHGLDQPISLVAASGDGLASAAIEIDRWASQHLGFVMGRLTTVTSIGGEVRRTATALLEQLATAARDAAIDLLVCRVDEDDHDTLRACIAAGFTEVDREVVYLADATTVRPPRGAADVEVTLHHSSQLPPFAEEERGRLLDRAASFRGSHIGADTRISPEASAAFYRAWTANALDGRWGDRLAVARIDGRMIGCFSWVLDHDLGAIGGPGLLHRSWSVVSEEGRGAFGSMLGAVVTDRDGASGVRFTECDTQASNVAVNGAFRRIPGMEPIRRSVVHHLWTDVA